MLPKIYKNAIRAQKINNELINLKSHLKFLKSNSYDDNDTQAMLDKNIKELEDEIKYQEERIKKLKNE